MGTVSNNNNNNFVGKIHQWMVKLVDESLKKNRIFAVSKYKGHQKNVYTF